jgi:hypothetical protein
MVLRQPDSFFTASLMSITMLHIAFAMGVGGAQCKRSGWLSVFIDDSQLGYNTDTDAQSITHLQNRRR